MANLFFGFRRVMKDFGRPADAVNLSLTRRAQLQPYGAELDLPTLVWTRGATFPLARLESRLKCPACGSRRVRLAFSVPSESNRQRA